MIFWKKIYIGQSCNNYNLFLPWDSKINFCWNKENISVTYRSVIYFGSKQNQKYFNFFNNFHYYYRLSRWSGPKTKLKTHIFSSAFLLLFWSSMKGNTNSCRADQQSNFFLITLDSDKYKKEMPLTHDFQRLLVIRS